MCNSRGRAQLRLPHFLHLCRVLLHELCCFGSIRLRNDRQWRNLYLPHFTTCKTSLPFSKTMLTFSHNSHTSTADRASAYTGCFCFSLCTSYNNFFPNYIPYYQVDQGHLHHLFKVKGRSVLILSLILQHTCAQGSNLRINFGSLQVPTPDTRRAFRYLS